MYAKKVSKCIAIINKAKYILGKDSLSSLNTSIIESHLTHCVKVWGRANKSLRNHLYVKQKRLIHLKTKSGYMDQTANLFKGIKYTSFFPFNKVQDSFFYA